MQSGHGDRGLTAIVPVKALRHAKTRTGLSGSARKSIALEMAAQTVRTLAQTPEVTRTFVVTSDNEVAKCARLFGAAVVPEPRWSSLGLALTLGRRQARRAAADDDILVMVSDLPNALSLELSQVVWEFRQRHAPLMVVDHEQTGTTCLIHGGSDESSYHFGSQSAQRHALEGFQSVQSEVPGLRCDLDRWPFDPTPRWLSAVVEGIEQGPQ